MHIKGAFFSWSGWRSRIESLIFNNLPSVPDAATRMDLIADWQKHPVWA
jgi:hypothetical protein